MKAEIEKLLTDAHDLLLKAEGLAVSDRNRIAEALHDAIARVRSTPEPVKNESANVQADDGKAKKS